MSSPSLAACLHCGSPVPPGAAHPTFCCAGCEAVHGLLVDGGLTRYYTLAGEGGVSPTPEVARTRSLAWLEPLRAQAEGAPGSVCSLELDVQGIHCAACVWLMNELFRREAGGSELTVNPALGKVRLRWQRGRFDLAGYLTRVERFGYLFGPSRKKAHAASLELPVRLGVSAAITMNVMMFSFAFYLGLTPAEGELFTLFTRLSVVLSTVTVGVGGWPFFRAAWQGLRSRVLHLDLPIALGILLVWATSMLQVQDGRGDLAYFDTLNTFVTLMLVGRWLQQRVLERNRRFLLEDDGAEGLVVRRLEGDQLSVVALPRVRAGDVLLVAPGDLVPVEAQLLEPGGRFSTDWMTGEPTEKSVGEGERVPAGSFSAGRAAVRVRACTSFQESPLVALLRQAPAGARGGGVRPTRFWDLLARSWVAGVLCVAGVGLALWWPAGPARALEVAVALLVVTCPCALGIAVPLAYELVQARLRREGFFVRSADLLDRLPRVRQLLFDKTGTLTLGRLELVDRSGVESLAAEARDAAYTLAARSNHPVSRCLATALARAGARYAAAAQVTEVPGCGLEMQAGGRRWRLGAAGWARGDAARQKGAASPHPSPLPGGAGGAVLTCDGAPVASFAMREAVRADARRELAALQAEGKRVWLISGDAPARVAAMAEALGVPAAQALGGQQPEAKAAAVRRIDRADTLYLGDGVNDSLAFEAALCAGTPAIDRPVMPGKSDFFLLGEGLASLRAALHLSQELRATVRQVLVRALAYNVLVVGVSLAGWMTPLRAAIAMPASSLAILLFTVWRLSGRRRAAAPAPAERLEEATA